MGGRLGTLCLLAAAVALAAPGARAAPIPFKKGTAEVAANGRGLRDFMTEFFHEQGLEVIPSQQVAARGGTLNGNVGGTYAQVWRKVAGTNDLLSYWDGSAVYVYLNTERRTDYASVPLPVEQQFLAAMASVNWADAASGNVWRMEPSTGLVTATGTPRFIEQVKQMAQTVSGLGHDATTRFKFYPLKYAWASDTTMTVGNRQVTIPGVASVLRALVGDGQDGGQFGVAGDRLLAARQRGLRGSGLVAQGRSQQPPPPLGDYSEPPPDDDGLTPPSAPLGPRGNPGSGLESVAGGGNARIVADTFRNAIIVRDTPDRLPMYDELIRNLDVAPQMVEIEATIIDVDKTKARKLGMNWFYRNRGITAGFTSGTNIDPNTGLDVSKIGLVGALAGGKTGAALSFLPALFGGGGQIGAIIGDPGRFVANVDALEDDNVTHVITHPQVITMNDAEAVIQNNQTIYVPVSGAYNSDLYNVVAGTTLRVTPHVVLENGVQRIRLMVQINDGSYTLQPKDENGVSYPIVADSAVNTQAVIQDGQGLLIGGLVQNKLNHAEQKIPFLGDIPVLGYLFKTTQKQRDRTERLFLITPRLVALNHIPGQMTPSSSQVSIESQEQLDKQEDRAKQAPVAQPLPSPAPVAQPPSVQPYRPAQPVQEAR